MVVVLHWWNDEVGRIDVQWWRMLHSTSQGVQQVATREKDLPTTRGDCFVVVSFVVVAAVAGGEVGERERGDCGCEYTIDCAVPFPPLSFFPVCVAPSFVRCVCRFTPYAGPNYTTPRS
jgi:hypothetical protein